MADILGTLFCTAGRVRILRLFLFNPDHLFESADVAKRARISPENARKEIATLSRIGFIKKRSGFKDVEKKKGKLRLVTKKKISGWMLDPTFLYRGALENFLVDATSLNNTEIARRLNKTGKLRLIIVSGVFLQDWDSRIDILIVGSKVNKPQLKVAISEMEAELGKELRYALFSVPDFKYRLGVYDRLVRDIFDYPHEVVVDRLGVSPHTQQS